MHRGKQIGLAMAALFVMVVAPSPDGQSVSHPPLVITADTSIFKAKPDDRTLTYPAQPSVYCGVTVC